MPQCFFSIWVFFYNHWQFTGLQGKVEGISLAPCYHLHPLHRHVDISRATERKPLTTKLRALCRQCQLTRSAEKAPSLITVLGKTLQHRTSPSCCLPGPPPPFISFWQFSNKGKQSNVLFKYHSMIIWIFVKHALHKLHFINYISIIIWIFVKHALHKLHTGFFYKESSFSIQPQCCLTF